jgi:hypothetical protein
MRARDKLILATVEATGTVDKPELYVELKSNMEITAEDKKKNNSCGNHHLQH